MKNHTSPEFIKACNHCMDMLNQYGEHHPNTEQAFMLVLHHMPEHVKAEMNAKAKELNLLPPVSGYTDDGVPICTVEDIAKHLGMSPDETEQHIFQMMDTRQKAGLSNEGILIASDSKINRAQ